MQAEEFNRQLMDDLGNTNPQNREPTITSPTKRTGNNMHILLSSNLIGARQSNSTHLFPATSGNVPFTCPHLTYPNSYVLVCEGRWRSIAGRKQLLHSFIHLNLKRILIFKLRHIINFNFIIIIIPSYSSFISFFIYMHICILQLGALPFHTTIIVLILKKELFDVQNVVNVFSSMKKTVINKC